MSALFSTVGTEAHPGTSIHWSPPPSLHLQWDQTGDCQAAQLCPRSGSLLYLPGGYSLRLRNLLHGHHGVWDLLRRGLQSTVHGLGPCGSTCSGSPRCSTPRIVFKDCLALPILVEELNCLLEAKSGTRVSRYACPKNVRQYLCFKQSNCTFMFLYLQSWNMT